MKFRLLQGEAAERWLDDKHNRQSWSVLQSFCPWASASLSSEFISIWYRHYSARWCPVVVLAEDDQGELCGVLPLARNGGEFVGAGAHQAEYQGWLCTPEQFTSVANGSLQILVETWPDMHLRLRYIDMAGGGEQFLAWAIERADTAVIHHPRPLIRLDASDIDTALRKRSNRSKLNRLKRAGELELRRDQLDADGLDEIIALYDFRQGAANGSCPFAEDDRKRALHLDFLQQAPSEFVIYRMMLDGRLVAALLGLRGPRVVSNAILTYSPHHARHSPGKLLLYLAAQALLDEEVDYLDLTPGGDPWKERFATEHDEVFEMHVWGSVNEARRHDRQQRQRDFVRRSLLRAGIKPSSLRAWLNKVRRFRPAIAWHFLRRQLPQRTEHKVYCSELDNVSTLPEIATSTAGELRIDSLDDLVRFVPTSSIDCRQQFLSSALKRIENGKRVYSVHDEGTTSCYGWLTPEGSEAYFGGVDASFILPASGAILGDFYTNAALRSHDSFRRTVVTMLRDLKEQSDQNVNGRVVYISAPADNKASWQIIEELGFGWVGSVVQFSAFGYSRCTQIQKSGK